MSDVHAEHCCAKCGCNPNGPVEPRPFEDVRRALEHLGDVGEEADALLRDVTLFDLIWAIKRAQTNELCVNEAFRQIDELLDRAGVIRETGVVPNRLQRLQALVNFVEHHHGKFSWSGESKHKYRIGPYGYPPSEKP